MKGAIGKLVDSLGPHQCFGLATFGDDALHFYDLMSTTPHSRRVRLRSSGDCSINLTDVFPWNRLLVSSTSTDGASPDTSSSKESSPLTAAAAAAASASSRFDGARAAIASLRPSAGGGGRPFGPMLRQWLGFFSEHAGQACVVRLVCLLSGTPDVGPGAVGLPPTGFVPPRDDPHNFYKSHGILAAEAGICIDVLALRRSELASSVCAPLLRQLCSPTGGHLRVYDSTDITDGRFVADVGHMYGSRRQGGQCMMRLRTHSDVTVRSWSVPLFSFLGVPRFYCRIYSL